MSAHTAISICPVIDAQQREIDHWLSRIRTLEARMDRMISAQRLSQAERQLSKMLDHVDALNDEMLKMDFVW